MRVIDPNNTPTRDLHQFLLGIVGPRPIALVSTVDKDGRPNVAPYSFYNAFSSNPPTVVFSSNRRVIDNTTKDTLANIKATGEAVIHAVNHDIVRQMTITSVQFDSDINEFEKAGFTALPSDIVKPFRIKESPAHMECKVKDIITLGDHGGAGHLIICDVVRIHLDEGVLDDSDRINPHKIDLMGRMGRAYYVRASGPNVSAIVQPVTEICLGYDQLPESIRTSNVFSANNVAQLAGLFSVPSKEQIDELLAKEPQIKELLKGPDIRQKLHAFAKEILDLDDKNRSKAGCLAWLADKC